jgi:hypothetical protein
VVTVIPMTSLLVGAVAIAPGAGAGIAARGVGAPSTWAAPCAPAGAACGAIGTSFMLQIGQSPG